VPAKQNQAGSAMISTNYDSLLEKAQTASNVRLPEMAYIYLASIMIGQGHDLAGRHGIKVKSKGDREIFSTLSFKGVLPEEITRDCLSGISHGMNLFMLLIKSCSRLTKT
jgi:hypothetical protein